MNIIEAINTRKSIRGFKPDSVDQATIAKILHTAVRAPSAMNTQPWEFFVVTGEKLGNMRDKIVEKLHSGPPKQPAHLTEGQPLDNIYKNRQVALAKQLFKLMDIQREDREKRTWWLERGFRYFDAPIAIIVVTDKTLRESWTLFDIGAVVNNICLAALEYGLGTCIEDQGVLYLDECREIVKIPDTKRVVIAIALGYPDDDFPANKVKTERESVESITTWIGF